MTPTLVSLAQPSLSPALVGGKGAHLSTLLSLDGLHVPAGVCVTTKAFRDALSVQDLDALLREPLRQLGEARFAVRSSATAEDLPFASFAGQHDSFLNVPAARVAEHVVKVWNSLNTERAVHYRKRLAIDERDVAMAVVVQRMLTPRASGVLFTADPLTSNRKVVVIEATSGLGDALVSGQRAPESYRVRDGQPPQRAGGATSLSDANVLELAKLGRRLEAHFHAPVDVEWCLVGDTVHVVQCRPITTLFPVPAAPDANPRVYVSVGHQQMMTDAFSPLGRSLFQLTALRPMATAGGRLFVDITPALGTTAGRAALLETFGKGDPLVRDALETVLARTDFLSPPIVTPGTPPPAPPPLEAHESQVPALIEKTRQSLQLVATELAKRSGVDAFDFIIADLAELKRVLADPLGVRTFMSGMEAAWWLNAHLEEWLGEKNLADTLTQSVEDNVTSQMGLALFDVADVVRENPEALPQALEPFLAQYGMRGPGEIDLARPRWSERPSMLHPLVLGHVKNAAPNERKRRFEAGRALAERKAAEVLARIAQLPDGAQRVAETKRNLDRLRAFSGYREFPKFGLVSRFFLYKQALLREARALVGEGALQHEDELFLLTLDEVRRALVERKVDRTLLQGRRAEQRWFESLSPPRVLTSEGDALFGEWRRGGAPAGALLGLAVSSGVVEGRARVVLNLGDARFEPGDVLVTPHTDPSWTPAFLSVAALVTEVGGVMTHGAVIAREYGLPAVVGVTNATQRIRDGQRLRVHGSEGFVELLD